MNKIAFLTGYLEKKSVSKAWLTSKLGLDGVSNTQGLLNKVLDMSDDGIVKATGSLNKHLTKDLDGVFSTNKTARVPKFESPTGKRLKELSDDMGGMDDLYEVMSANEAPIARRFGIPEDTLGTEAGADAFGGSDLGKRLMSLFNQQERI